MPTPTLQQHHRSMASASSDGGWAELPQVTVGVESVVPPGSPVQVPYGSNLASQVDIWGVSAPSAGGWSMWYRAFGVSVPPAAATQADLEIRGEAEQQPEILAPRRLIAH